MRSGDDMRFRFQAAFFIAIFLIFSCAVDLYAAMSPDNLKHPRLYINTDKIQQLRSLKDQEPYSSWLRTVKIRARGLMGRSTPNSLVRYRSNTLRRPADSIVNFTFYYLLTNDIAALNNVERMLTVFCKTTKWADNNDLGAAHSIFALSVAYDWLYDELSPELKASLREAISFHASIFYDLLIKHKFWWTRSPLQNHNYVNTAALAVAAIALYGENPDAVRWLDESRKNFDYVLSLLSPDGASHEGVGYWSYGTLWLLNYYMAMAPFDGLDKVFSSKFFKNTSIYRLYTSLPGFKYNLDYADSAIVDYKGPGAILRCLASIFDDGHAQWLANKIERERSGRSALWQDLVWYSPQIKPISPDNLPLYRWFNYLGFLSSRSSWKDDATMFFFKAGPPQGFWAQSKKVYAGSHIHPDSGNYSFWKGRDPLVQDDGYVSIKLSSSHNVMTFNDFGQLGEGTKFLRIDPYRKDNGHMVPPDVVLKHGYQMVSGEFSTLYPKLAGIKYWNRAIAIIGGRTLVVRDKAATNSPKEMVSSIHLTRKAHQYGDAVCLDSGSDIVLNTKYLSGSTVDLKRYTILIKPMGKGVPRTGMLYTIKSTNMTKSDSVAVIAESSQKCSDETILQSYDQSSDRAFVKDKYGSYDIDFLKMSVRILKDSL